MNIFRGDFAIGLRASQAKRELRMRSEEAHLLPSPLGGNFGVYLSGLMSDCGLTYASPSARSLWASTRTSSPALNLDSGVCSVSTSLLKTQRCPALQTTIFVALQAQRGQLRRRFRTTASSDIAEAA